MLYRKRVSKRDTRQLWRSFLGGRCVISGQVGDAVQLHHPGEDPSRSGVFDVMYLRADWNAALSVCRKRVEGGAPPELPGALEPDALEATARTHHRRWDPRLACGCARLAYYIGLFYKREDPGRLLRRAARVIYYARHSGFMEMVRVALETDILPVLGRMSSLERSPVASLLREIHGIYSDHGELEMLLDVEAWASRFVRSRARYLTITEEAGFYRRTGITAIARDDKAAVVWSFREANELDPMNSNNRLTMDLGHGLAYLDRGQPSKAMDTLAEDVTRIEASMDRAGFSTVGTPPDTDVYAWNAADILLIASLAQSQVASSTGEASSARDRFYRAIGIYARSGVQPFLLTRKSYAAATNAIGTLWLESCEFSYMRSPLKHETRSVLDATVHALHRLAG